MVYHNVCFLCQVFLLCCKSNNFTLSHFFTALPLFMVLPYFNSNGETL